MFPDVLIEFALRRKRGALGRGQDAVQPGNESMIAHLLVLRRVTRAPCRIHRRRGIHNCLT